MHISWGWGRLRCWKSCHGKQWSALHPWNGCFFVFFLIFFPGCCDRTSPSLLIEWWVSSQLQEFGSAYWNILWICSVLGGGIIIINKNFRRKKPKEMWKQEWWLHPSEIAGWNTRNIHNPSWKSKTKLLFWELGGKKGNKIFPFFSVWRDLWDKWNTGNIHNPSWKSSVKLFIVCWEKGKQRATKASWFSQFKGICGTHLPCSSTPPSQGNLEFGFSQQTGQKWLPASRRLLLHKNKIKN